jgi:hypothetical protein
LAPGRFSTITLCPSTGLSSVAIKRPSKSFDPPGAKWTMIVIACSGHSARTGVMPIDTTITVATDIHFHARFNMVFPPIFQVSGLPEFNIAFSEAPR